MKTCPTCGREIADAASVCGSCEAWAAALVEPPADDAARAPERSPLAGDLAAVAAMPVLTPAAPAATAPAAAPAATGAGSRRRLALIAAGVAIVAMTGFAMAARGKSPAAAPVTASAGAPAARVTPRSTTASAAAPAPPSTVTPVQTWSTANQATWLDNPRRGAAFELLSENIVKTAFGASRPSLVVRCASKQIEAFVVTGSPMKIDPRIEGKTVTISLDGEPFRTEQWTDSNGRTAVFAPNPEAFTARLRAASMLHFGYSPHGAGDVVAQFHVAGIDALIGAASKHCGPAK